MQPIQDTARTWRIDTATQTLVFAARLTDLPSLVYWGQLLPADENLAALHKATQSDITGGMPAVPPAITLCPTGADQFSGHPAAILRRVGGAHVQTNFSLSDVSCAASSLRFICTDKGNGLHLELTFEVLAGCDSVKAWTSLKSNTTIALDWLSTPVIQAPQASTDILHFSGVWCRELQENQQKWQAGALIREARLGRSGHNEYPGLYLTTNGTTNTNGEAWALQYGWSGGHKMIAEQLQHGARQVQWGSYYDAGREFETAPLYLTYSNTGLNGCSISFQRLARQELTQTTTTRPIHYNCWEAVYFDHKIDILKNIATQAADLGAERFVLDDGWFKGRVDDTTGLGDWTVDEVKYPDGLTPLIDHIHNEGMEFGLWVEPEMISPLSDLFKAHPEWVLGDLGQTLERNQYALDMARAEVQDYLFDCVAELLNTYEINYLKWDHNRALPLSGMAQMRGTYALIDKIRSAFPRLELETCAAGGGRIDAGMLLRSNRVWLSDTNDALERLRIQHSAALFLPAAVTGSHVGPRRCHTSGRVHDIEFRAWVAAQRHMGFEMDPRELTSSERVVLKRVVSWWKAQRTWLMKADIYRLDSLDKAIIAEQHLCLDRENLVVFSGKIDTLKQSLPKPLRLTGLDPKARYELMLISKAPDDQASYLSQGHLEITQRPVVLSGQFLMSYGLQLPWIFPNTMTVIQGRRL